MTHSDRALVRSIDILASLVLLMVAGLPMLGIAVAIRLHDGDPALFRQQRVGRSLGPFTIYKFRTMRHEPAAAVSRTSVSTDRGDPRISPLGRFLRPSHLDELPQLFNVLKGDMSLVGVRPDTPVQESDYPATHWAARHRFRPGLTGPSQILRGDVTMSMRIAAEQEWIARASLGLYLVILARTVGKVLSNSSN